MDRSAVVPVLSFSVPLAETDEAAMPVAVVDVAAPLAFTAVLHAGGKVDGLQGVGNRRALQVDGRVAAAVGDEVAD